MTSYVEKITKLFKALKC